MPGAPAPAADARLAARYAARSANKTNKIGKFNKTVGIMPHNPPGPLTEGLEMDSRKISGFAGRPPQSAAPRHLAETFMQQNDGLEAYT
jgi:hypothetical protein